MSRQTLQFLTSPDDFSNLQMIILTQDFAPAFSGSIPMKTTVKPIKKAMEHPIETGAIITDHVILMPIEITVSMFVQAKDVTTTYDKITQYYNNSTLLIVQTRTAVYSNQYISEIPHDENPDQFNSIEMIIKLKQAQVTQSSSATNVTPKVPSNASTINTGSQNPLTIDPSTLTPTQIAKLQRAVGG